MTPSLSKAETQPLLEDVLGYFFSRQSVCLSQPHVSLLPKRHASISRALLCLVGRRGHGVMSLLCTCSGTLYLVIFNDLLLKVEDIVMLVGALDWKLTLGWAK